MSDRTDRDENDQTGPLVIDAPIFENFRPTKPKIIQGQVVQPAGIELTFWLPLSEAEGKMERIGRLYGQTLTSVIVDFPEQLVLGLAPVNITRARRGGVERVIDEVVERVNKGELNSPGVKARASKRTRR